MLTTQYLYDCEPTDFAYKPYVQALNIKVAKAEVLMAKISKISRGVSNPDAIVELTTRYQSVEKAKKHNEKLLMELDQEE